MTNCVLKIESLSKQYRLGEVGTGTISHDLNRFIAKARGKEDPFSKIGETNDREKSSESKYVWALRDINFEVKKGEILGIIGKNGAGKSTLLKLISKITSPTEGSIKAKGRIASLLEVGTGMHPEMTARENIYLNGAILGMRKAEISRKFDEILEFAGCARYVDTPIKRFSSGMSVRLGFAVAAFLEPEILIVDEVLAVGDAEFQKKSIGKMKEVATTGRTVLFVSHNLSSIRNLCQKVIVLDKGEVCFNGDVEEGIDHYLHLSSTLGTEKVSNPFKFGLDESLPIQMTEISIKGSDGQLKEEFEFHEQIVLEISCLIRKPSSYYYSILRVEDSLGNVVFVSTDEDLAESKIVNRVEGKYTYSVKWPLATLKPGQYFITLSIAEKNVGAIHIEEKVRFILINDNFSNRSLKGLYRTRSIIAPELNWELKE